MSRWGRRISERLDGIRRAEQWRSIRSLDGMLPEAQLEGRPIVSFASNDYLGLAVHPAVSAAAQEAVARWGTGSGASRLVVGGRPVHAELERELADWKGTEAALLLPTGFAANLAVLSVVADDPEVLVISDQRNHASIIDGCRLGRGRVAVARHNDIGHVDALLAAHDGPAVVVTDTVFSMDGDVAPIDELAGLCGRHGALLVLDEAHAVLGPCLDLSSPPWRGVEVVLVGTLSKALGSLGGFVAAGRDLIDLLVNTARPFIFTTAPTPGDTAAGLAALRILRAPEGRRLVERLWRHIELVRPGHPSPIIPIMLGSEAAALAASEHLLAQGLLVPAIRPPTVPPGTSRLRVALSAAHTEEQVDQLVRALADLPTER